METCSLDISNYEVSIPFSNFARYFNILMCPKKWGSSGPAPKNWSHESQANQSDTSDDEAIRNLGRAGGWPKHPTEKELDST